MADRIEPHDLLDLLDPPDPPDPLDPLDPLIMDLLEWLSAQPRTHADVMDTWRTSCPHLPVWESAEQRGFVTRQHVKGSGTIVSVTPQGQAFLGRRARNP